MMILITVDEINNTKFNDKVKFGRNVLIGKNVSIGSNCKLVITPL
jgi:UDP-3-O-[3-hydroxymyristoyl] glucosamine N-acyltransferase